MRTVAIFLLFFSITSGLAAFPFAHHSDSTSDAVYKGLVKSAKSKSSNDTRLFLPSFNPSVKADGRYYFFSPESLGWAAYDHPEKLNLTGYSQTCLASWATNYNNSFVKCVRNGFNGTTPVEVVCKALGVVRSSDECETRFKSRPFEAGKERCLEGAQNLGEQMDNILFPDGRSVFTVNWDCGYSEECYGWGCRERFSPPIIIFKPAPGPNASDVLFILAKITGACAMIALGIRWAVYVQQRQRLRAQIMVAQAGPLPAKEGVPVDAVAYSPSKPHACPSNLHVDFAAPPPYMAPPAYSEKPIEPLPKIA